MRAHTISTKPEVRGRGHTKRTIVPGGVLALGLAVALLVAGEGPAAALIGTGASTPAPAGAAPLTLAWYPPIGGPLPRKVGFVVATNNDSTLVVSGRKIKATTKQLAAGEQTMIKAGLKRKRLCKGHAQGVTVKFAATDQFGQRATDAGRLKIYVSDDASVWVMRECPCHNPLPPCGSGG